MSCEVRSPMPGKIVRVVKQVGDPVAAGETIMIMEAMKMEMPVAAPAAGTIRDLPVGVEKAVAKDDILVVID